MLKLRINLHRKKPVHLSQELRCMSQTNPNTCDKGLACITAIIWIAFWII